MPIVTPAGRPLLALCLAAGLLAGCDDPPSPSPTPTPPPGSEQITGRERIGWDQPAATVAELATFRYLLYVDNASVELIDVACENTPGDAGFPCTAALPGLAGGTHVLSISSFTQNGMRLESARSVPLTVFVTGQASTASAADGSIVVTTTDGVRLQARVLTDQLDEPTDLAFAPDGRLFVAERGGRIRVVRRNRLLLMPAVTIDDVDRGSGRGLLSVAVDPRFAENGYVYALYTFRAAFRLVRFRATGDALRERAILIDGIESSPARPAGLVRFGPDGKLYLAIDNGGDWRRSGDLGSYNGKVLRLNADLTTPPDQAAGTPVYAADLASPRGVAWDAAGTLWVVEDEASGSDRLHALIVPPVIAGRQAGQASAAARYALPPGTGAAGLVAYRGSLIPAFAGNLLVAGDAGRALLRVRPDPSSPQRIAATEWILRDAVGPIHAVAVGPDGEIVLGAGTRLVSLLPAMSRTPSAPGTR